MSLSAFGEFLHSCASPIASRITSKATLHLIAGEWLLRFFISDHFFCHVNHRVDWLNWPRAPLTPTDSGFFSDVTAFFTQRAIRDLLRTGESIRPSQHRFKGPLETTQATQQALQKKECLSGRAVRQTKTGAIHRGCCGTSVFCSLRRRPP